jgi:hypothetical protein
MIDLDSLVGRMMDLETRYYDLQDKYQLLIHQYEQLKAKYEDSAGHRNGQQAQENSLGGNQGH